MKRSGDEAGRSRQAGARLPRGYLFGADGSADPAQNNSFRDDHYLDVPFHISQVLVSAPLTDGSHPEPLRDPQEIIELPGYTGEEEKAAQSRTSY